MCGRYALFSHLSQIREAFDVQEVAWEPEPSYNIAPTDAVAVVVQRDGTNWLEKMIWGLIPFWAKDPKIGARMINARAETLSDKPSFKRPFRSQRCLVVADGFFEWAKTDDGKVPMFIHPKSGEPLGMAGLYDVWKPSQGDPVTSCTIVTTQPNDLMRPIHDRMPLLLTPSQVEVWLDHTSPAMGQWLAALDLFPSRDLEAYPVSRYVNSPRNNGPECVQPLS